MAKHVNKKSIEKVLEEDSLCLDHSPKTILSISFSESQSFSAPEEFPKSVSNTIDSTPKDSWGLSPIIPVPHSLNSFSALSEKSKNSKKKPNVLYLQPSVNTVEEVNESSRSYLSPGCEDKVIVSTPTFPNNFEKKVTWQSTPEIEYKSKDKEQSQSFDNRINWNELNCEGVVEYPKIVVSQEAAKKVFVEKKGLGDKKGFYKEKVIEEKKVFEEKKRRKEVKSKSNGCLEGVIRKNESIGFDDKEFVSKEKVVEDLMIRNFGDEGKKCWLGFVENRNSSGTSSSQIRRKVKNITVPSAGQNSFLIASKPQPRMITSKSEKKLKKRIKSNALKHNESIEYQTINPSLSNSSKLKDDLKKPKTIERLSPYSIKLKQNTFHSASLANLKFTFKNALGSTNLNKVIKKRKIVLSQKNP